MQSDNVTYLYGKITKADPSKRIVEGYISSGDVDVSGQIVDQDWLKGELPPWLREYGNIREQHRADSAVGKAQSVDLDTLPGPYLAAKIVDDKAWEKVEEGVYNGFSVGIKAPKIVRDTKAPQGRIVGGKLIEISIVDRPANDAAKFTLLKSAGVDEWTDCQTGVTVGTKEPNLADDAPPGSPLAALKAAQPTLTKCDMDGCDCDCAMGAPDPDCDCECAFCAAARASVDKSAIPDATKREFSTADRKRLASSGAAMPDGSYPIANESDLRNAISAFGRAKDPEATKRHIIKRAKALGRTDLLPADWPGLTKKETKSVDIETTPVVADAEKARTPKSEPTHAHPFKGVHNHTHDDLRGGTHTHAHMHDDDDMHDHPHLMGKDARMLSPEDRQDAMRYYTAAPDATKASPDWNIENPQPGVISRPGRIEGELPESNDFADAIRRIERLANQTDDRDGDVDTPANMEDDAMQKREAADFQGDNPKPSLNDPGKLELLFSATVKSIERLDARLAALESQTITKTADAMKTVAQVTAAMPDLVKAFDVIARDAEAKSAEIEALKTAHADILADLAKVKQMAQPPKGVVAVTKGIGIEPDRYLSAHDGREVNEIASFIEKALAGDDNDRRDIAEQVTKALYAKNNR